MISALGSPFCSTEIQDMPPNAVVILQHEFTIGSVLFRFGHIERLNHFGFSCGQTQLMMGQSTLTLILCWHRFPSPLVNSGMEFVTLHDCSSGQGTSRVSKYTCSGVPIPSAA